MKEFDLIIKGKYILPMNENLDIIEDGFAAVKNDEIVEVDFVKNLIDYKAKEEINSGNSIIMPGLINTHTHVAMSMFRGLADDVKLNDWLEKYIWPAEVKYVNSNFVKLSSRLGCLEMLKAGITCFNDMYFFSEETIQVASQMNIRLLAGEGIINFPTPSSETPEIAIQKTIDLIKKYQDSDLIDIVFNPHSIYTCDKKYLEQIRDLAQEYNKLSHIHISETKKELEDSQKKYGMSPVEYLDSFDFLGENVIAAHSVWLSENDLAIYKKRGVKVSHNSISNMKLASGIAPVNKFLKKGIVVGLATDGPASNNTQDLFSEMRIAGLLQKVNNLDPTALSAREIVKMATIEGAKVLNKNKKIGSLEPGKKADIITIDLNKPHLTPIYDPYSHLVYCAESQDVSNVVINGVIVVRDREVKTIKEKEVLEHANNYKIDLV